MRWGKRLSAVVAATAFACMMGAGAAEAFDAHGSVEQVYATGLAAGQQTSLLDRRGHTVARQKATAPGGVLFRDVKAGSGYRVRAGATRSPALTVLSTQSAPPSTGVYDQSIPSKGYGYLTMRDGTKLAIAVHPPSDVSTAFGADLPEPPGSAPYPTLIEYAG